MRELSLNVLDIAQNSITAGSTLTEITVDFDTTAKELTITISDNGCGMDEHKVKNVVDPFYTSRTTRKVGLGVPFYKMAAEMTGGRFHIESTPGVGTTSRAVFCYTNIDCMPLGDINDTIAVLIQCNPQLDFLYTYKLDGKEFKADTREFREILGDVPLNTNEVVVFIRDYLKENTESINGGVNPI